jgi:DNA polymerase-3 subunit epsilon
MTAKMAALARQPFRGWAVVDVETTGLHPARNRIIEIAVVRLTPDAEPIDEWTTLVDPETPSLGSRLHGITRRELAGAPKFRDLISDLLSRLSGRVIVAHNAPYDVAFLQAETVRAGIAWGPIEGLCTMQVLQSLRITKSRKLNACCSDLGLSIGREHVALNDALAVASILDYLGPRLWAIATPPPAPEWPSAAEPAPIRPRPKDAIPEPPPDLARQVRVPSGIGVSDSAAATYLGLLDHVLEDGRVTENEVEALGLFAKACGIDRDIARQLHLAYLKEMSRLARADGVVTEEERAYLENMTPMLSAALPR